MMTRKQYNQLAYLGNSIFKEALLRQKIERMQMELTNLTKNITESSVKLFGKEVSDQDIINTYANTLPDDFETTRKQYENKLSKVSFGTNSRR